MSARARRTRELAAYARAAEVGMAAVARRAAAADAVATLPAAVPDTSVDAACVLGAVLARARRDGETATITVPTAVLDEWLARYVETRGRASAARRAARRIALRAGRAGAA